jgi:predicted amidophosphoribosyltransferase
VIWTAILDIVFPAQCAGCNAFGSGLCRHCAPLSATPIVVRLPGLSGVAYGAYEGTLRSAVLALKDGRRDVAEALGERLAQYLDSDAELIPVPTTAARRRVRGIDGVCLVAATAARLAGARVTEALVHQTGDAQRGRTRDARLAAQNRFGCCRSLEGCTVTLIDDVCTTGATLADCARAVRSAGGNVKGAVVVAATKSIAACPTNRRD